MVNAVQRSYRPYQEDTCLARIHLWTGCGPRVLGNDDMGSHVDHEDARPTQERLEPRDLCQRGGWLWRSLFWRWSPRWPVKSQRSSSGETWGASSSPLMGWQPGKQPCNARHVASVRSGLCEWPKTWLSSATRKLSHGLKKGFGLDLPIVALDSTSSHFTHVLNGHLAYMSSVALAFFRLHPIKMGGRCHPLQSLTGSMSAGLLNGPPW